MGLKGISFDVLNGWDFTVKANRDWVKEELRLNPPELLVICPPCTDAGGWFNLNSLYMSCSEVLSRRRKLKTFMLFVKDLIRQQVAAGGRFLFEHPAGSDVWHDDEMQQWCQELTSFITHMCCFDLHLPARGDKPKRYIRKSTRLLCSHPDMEVLQRHCPGESAPEHVHATIAGSEPGIGSMSKHAGRYTRDFVCAEHRAEVSFMHRSVSL